MMSTEIEKLESSVVYQNRWMKVHEDKIRRADGSTGIYGVVKKNDFAVIAALEDESIYLVEQYRYPVGARYWELPQGSWESESLYPLDLAKAELLEETGLKATTMTHVGRLFPAYGFCSQAFNVFVACELQMGEARLDIEEQGLISRRFNIAQVKSMICEGTIVDATTVAAIGLLSLKELI